MAELVFTAMPCVGPVTGIFGQTHGYRSAHRGVDIGCPPGTPISWTGTGPGKVVDFTNDGSFGIGVCIDALDTPWYSLTAHMSEAHVEVGDPVEPGQMLGLSGFSGFVDPPGPAGAHCHWQVCRRSTFPLDIAQSTDPLAMIRPGGVEPREPDRPQPRVITLEERVSALMAALTGLSDTEAQMVRLKLWNFYPPDHAEFPGKPRGNSLLDGYIALSRRLADMPMPAGMTEEEKAGVRSALQDMLAALN